MDDRRFDDLLRSLSTAAPRRGVLAGLTSGLLGLVPIALGIREATAKRCPPCRKKKRGTCKKKRPNGTPCGECRQCQTGRCVTSANGSDCGAGGTNRCCGGACVDTATEEAHCGACNQPCPANLPTCCAGECVDTDANAQHCRGCGNACLPGDICQPGEGCCTAPLTGCTEANDRCCGESTCTGFFLAQRVCCGISNVSGCGPLCAANTLCATCCSSHCGNAGLCADCVPNGGSCPTGCNAGQACAACCSGRCGANGRCCKPTGAKCTEGSECCGGACRQPSGPGFATCT